MDGHRHNVARSISRLCSLGLFLSGCLFYTSALIQPYYTEEFHLVGWRLGLAQSCVPLGAIIGAIQAGWVADLFGRQRLLRWNFLLLTITGVFGALAYNFETLCVSRVVNGYLAGTLYPLCAAYLIEMTPPDLVSRKTATLMFLNCLASPIACLVALALSLMAGDQILWHLLAGMHVVPAFIAYVWSSYFPESGTWLFFMENATEKEAKTKFSAKLSILFGSTYRNVTLCLLASWFLMDVAYYGVNFFMPYLLQGMSGDGGGMQAAHSHKVMIKTFIINTFFGIGALMSILAIQRIDSYKLQKYGFLCAALSLFILGYYFYGGSHRVYFMIALFVIFNFSINIGPKVTTYLLPATSYPVEVRATGHGISAGIAKFGSFLGVLMLPILQMSLGFGAVLIALSVLLFIAYLLTAYLARYVVSERALERVEAYYEKL